MKKLLVVLLASALALAACASPTAANTPAIPGLGALSTAAPTPARATAANTWAAPTVAPTATLADTTPASGANATPTASAAPATAAAGRGYTFTAVAQGFSAPLLVTHAGDGSGRLFVVEQGGLIKIVKDGAALPQPFIDLSNLVTHGGSEQGLLGLAFDPHYAQSGQFYVDYTDPNGDTRMARYHVSASDPNQADPNSAQILLRVAQPYPNHNGGNLVFGPDGYLYVSLGDGGSQGDPHGNGQNLGVLLGKILRLDVSGGGNQYSIPPSNPFAGQSGAKGEVWVYGVRNPWRATFDRATGDFWIGDVGQDTYEEIDRQPAGDMGGEDYGWNYMEGLHPYQGQAPAGANLTAPIAEYSHQEGGCAVTGGYVYRGASLPEMDGLYIFGDYCSGLTWTLTGPGAGGQRQRTLFLKTGFTISSFGQDEAGEFYACDYSGGGIYRLARAQ